jgi:hypothetical protein
MRDIDAGCECDVVCVRGIGVLCVVNARARVGVCSSVHGYDTERYRAAAGRRRVRDLGRVQLRHAAGADHAVGHGNARAQTRQSDLVRARVCAAVYVMLLCVRWEHWRAGGVLAVYPLNAHYDFNRQLLVAIDAHVEPGDTIVTHCVYDTRSTGVTTFGGEGGLACVCLHA